MGEDDPPGTSMTQPPETALARQQPHAKERRRHYRVGVALLGRYMLADGREYPCQTADISPGGALVVAPVRGTLGERVVMYLEHIGRIEGAVTRHDDSGFAMSISATARKRDKIASQLTWLANRDALGLPEDRRHERIVPRRGAIVLKLESGREIATRLIDVSLSGAAVAVAKPVPINTPVMLGRTPGKVVRHFGGGIAVEFLLPLSPDRFDENIVL
jgi:c-di-GMP-binding flagellar brake protein YcgR